MIEKNIIYLYTMNGANFTHKAQEAILSAQSIAQGRGQQQIDALHLLLALLSQEESVVLTLLRKLGADIENLKKKTKGALNIIPTIATPQTFGQFYLTQDMAKVLERARQEAMKMGDEFISVEHLFLGLLGSETKAKEILDKATFIKSGGGTASLEFGKLDYETILKTLAQIRGGTRITDPEPESKYQVVEKYARNLTTLAQQGRLDPVIGRENEIRRLMQVLSRRTKNNPVLIGEAGVGKTAIVEGLAQRIIRRDVPESLKEKEIIGLDLGALVAGTKYRGEFEDRVRALLKEINRAAGKYIVFIDELHTLVGAGAAEGAIDASNLLKPALARGELRAIGATTLKEYQKYIERDMALERRFQPIYVQEPSIEDTKTFLEDVSGSFEGVGMEIGIREEQLQVIAPLEGTPAQKAGLRPGDRIIKIDDTLTMDITIEEAITLIRGPKETEVTLTIFRDEWETSKEITIKRAVIKVPSLKWELLEEEIAYIKLYHFSGKSDRDFREMATEILKSPAEKIILDLRSNPGGYLERAQDIAGWFLKNGQVVIIEDFGTEKEQEVYKTEGNAKFLDYPMVVLVNQGSASASEILASALRDNRGIKIIGEASFGKGSVQKLEELRDGSSLKITIANWLTPKGNLITGKGLEPDIKVEMTEEDYQEERDPQLEKALEIIREIE